MDRLDAMGAFVAVADMRGFAPAARRLGISPSGVTRLVAGLEDRLGARLLARTTRSVSLTDAGARYLERARRILTDVAEAESAAQAERTVPGGRFVVTAPTVFGRLHVAPMMSAYLSRHPAVRGELLLGDRMANLVDEGIDAAVRIGVLSDSGLVARLVGSTRTVLVASPRYLARKKKIRTPADLSSHALLQLTALTPAAAWSFRQGSETIQVPFTPTYVTNSADAAIAHAESGAGVALVLAYQVVDAVRAGRLTVILSDAELAPLPIHVVYPTNRLLSAKVRTFLDLIVKTCDWRFLAL